MGSFSSAISTLNTAVGAFNTISRIAHAGDDAKAQDVALRQLQESQNLQYKNAREDAVLQKQTLQANAQTSERERREALKRAVARQRAKFGGQGISTNTGSSEAILLGLFDESETELGERERLDNLRFQAVDQNLTQQSRLNVLQATQLAERQRYKNTTLI